MQEVIWHPEAKGPQEGLGRGFLGGLFRRSEIEKFWPCVQYITG